MGKVFSFNKFKQSIDQCCDPVMKYRLRRKNAIVKKVEVEDYITNSDCSVNSVGNTEFSKGCNSDSFSFDESINDGVMLLSELKIKQINDLIENLQWRMHDNMPIELKFNLVRRILSLKFKKRDLTSLDCGYYHYYYQKTFAIFFDFYNGTMDWKKCKFIEFGDGFAEYFETSQVARMFHCQCIGHERCLTCISYF